MTATDPDSAEGPVIGLAERYLPGVVVAHAHRRAQIMFAVEGCLSVQTAVGSWILPPNRALWLPGGTVHALSLRAPAELRTLYLNQDVSWTRPQREVAVLQVPALVRELILSAVAAPWAYPDDSESFRLARVLCDGIATMAREPVHLPEPNDPRARKLAALYRADPGERRPIPVLAALVGASPSTLDRLFRSETSLGVGAWAQQLRLMLALERIGGGASVGDAAFAVGFENPSSFIALFKRQFGTTPGRYFAPAG